MADELQADVGSRKVSPLRWWLSVWLLIAASCYLAFVIGAQWQAIGDQFSQWSPAIGVGALLAALGMMALKCTYHVLLFRRLGQGRAPGSLTLASAYASSQVVRYLPGKVLGVVYQAAMLAPAVPAFRVVAANVVQGLYTNLLTVCVLASTVVWVWSASATIGGVAFVGSVALVACAHRSALVERGAAWVAGMVPGLSRSQYQWPVTSDWTKSFLGAGLLAAEWFPYFLIWFFLVPVQPDSSRLEMVFLLGACYAGASIAASFAVVMPSGLLVREAIFLYVASRLQFDPASIVALGAAARIILTVSDIVFAPLVSLIKSLVQER